jgi:hypothetical protein
MEYMGRVWSVDDLHDNGAMSQYATITTITESPLETGVIYAGTDDGNIQVTEDDGGSWILAGELPGVPALSFINDMEASLHDANAVFAAADAHKTGDYSPYLFRSNDRGGSWQSIRGDLPDGTVVWAVQQDHVDPDLLFLGTEYGIYFTPNGGANWQILRGGAPTISFRDIKIHRRDEDLVGATFGRGFYVLDDYTPLREMAGGALEGQGALFPVRDAWWYIPNAPGQAPGLPTQGSTVYIAPNPPFGAVITYWLNDLPETQEGARREAEKELLAQGEDVPFPGWERLRGESMEGDPQVLLLVRDAQGEPVRWIEGPAHEGLHRVNWDLRRPAPDAIRFSSGGFRAPWASDPRGPLAAPGMYQVELFLVTSNGVDAIGEAQDFEVKPVPTAPPGTDFAAVADFQFRVSELVREMAGAGAEMARMRDRLRHMRAALVQTPKADPGLYARIDEMSRRLGEMDLQFSGDPIRGQWNEPSVPSMRDRVGYVQYGHWDTRQEPTETQKASIEIAEREYATFIGELRNLIEVDLARLEADLAAAGAPWTPGRRLPGG